MHLGFLNKPYHPCLFFVKAEVGRKKKAEDLSDVKLLLMMVLMHANVWDAEKKRSRSVASY